MSRPIRLLAVSHTSALGGTQRHLYDLLTHFSMKDVAVIGVAAPSNGPMGQWFAQANLSYFDVSIPSLSELHSPQVVIQELIKLPLFLYQFSKLLRRESPDIVYCNSHRSAIVVEPVLTQLRIPLVWQIPEFIHDRPLQRWAISRIVRNAKGMVAISQLTYGELVKAGADTDKVRLAYCGVDVKKFDVPLIDLIDFRTQNNIPLDAKLVGMVGTIHPLKGWHILVESIPLIRKDFPNVHFIFTGTPNDDDFGKLYAAQIKQRLVELGQSESVRWLGYRADIPVIMSACDLLVQPNVEPETLGVVIMEGMAARKPVISTRIGGTLEVNEHGITGLVISPGQVDELVEAVKVLLENPELCEHMGVQGRIRVESLFTHEQRIQVHLDLFRQILLRAGRSVQFT